MTGKELLKQLDRAITLVTDDGLDKDVVVIRFSDDGSIKPIDIVGVSYSPSIRAITLVTDGRLNVQ